MTIKVVCECGSKLRAKESLAGKRVKCPKCGAVLSIPWPEPEVSDLAELSLDELADFESTAPAVDRTHAKTSRPLRHTPRRSSGDNKNLLIIVGAAAGGAAVLLIAGVLIFSLGRSDRDQPSLTAETTLPNESGSMSNGMSSSLRQPEASRDPQQRRPQPISQQDGGPPDQPTDEDKEAERTDTGNNKPAGMVLALSRWHAQSERDLVGTRFVDEDDQSLTLGYSWMCELLPYLDYERVHNRINFDKKWTDETNLPLTAIVIPEFLNPADSRNRWEGYPFEGMALTHFVGMSGAEDQRNVVAATLPRSDPRSGVFGYDEVTKPKDITDGKSKTIMLIGAGKIVAPWVQGGGSTIRGAREPYFDQITGFGLPSDKGRSTVAAFVDGSVRRITSDVDPRVLRALCTTHGHETVDSSAVGEALQSLPTKPRKELQALQQGLTYEARDPSTTE